MATARCRCSYRTATLLLCSCNIIAALFLLRPFVGPLSPFLSPSATVQAVLLPFAACRYTQDQLHHMRAASATRKAAQPLDLIMRIKEIREESTEGYGVKEPGVAKGAGLSGVAQSSKELRDSRHKSDKEALEEWRQKKLAAVRKRLEEAKKAKEEEDPS